ncbi:MAG: glycosyltransferase family A protein [Dermatophilus congolensis]|nr:glycosyltransferase family A protein [Dermatophilus congolensis]
MSTVSSESTLPAGVSVTIAVVTFRRNDALAGLLPRLADQAAAATATGNPAHVLVVDNDLAGGAAPVVEAAAQAAAETAGERTPTPVQIRYVHETEPGIAAARTRALDECATDVLVFIDDDEIPCDEWLAELLATRAATSAAAVAGPVLPAYPELTASGGEPLPWIVDGPFHASPDFTDGSLLTHAGTGNLLLDMRQIRALGVRMPAVGTRGGEDVMFTDRITRAGGEIIWCRRAVVTETIPADRLRPAWVLTRSMIDGSNESSRQLDPVAARTVLRRVALTGAGALRVGAGAARVAAGAARRSPGNVGGGLHTLMRGGGMCLGAWDIVHDGYARNGKPRWRRALTREA